MTTNHTAVPTPTIVARTRLGRRPRSASPMDRIAPTPPINRRLGSPFRSAARLATAMSPRPAIRRAPDWRGLGGSGRALTAEAMVIRVVRIEAATRVATVIKAPAAIDAAIATGALITVATLVAA